MSKKRSSEGVGNSSAANSKKMKTPAGLKNPKRAKNEENSEKEGAEVNLDEKRAEEEEEDQNEEEESLGESFWEREV